MKKLNFRRRQIMKLIRGKNLSYIPASHEDSKNPQVLKKVLLTYKDLVKGNVQMINWAKLPKGKKFLAHYHQDMQEIFIIMSGKIKVIIDEEERMMEKGDAVVVPFKSIHTMENVSSENAEYLVVGISTGKNGKTVQANYE